MDIATGSFLNILKNSDQNEDIQKLWLHRCHKDRLAGILASSFDVHDPISSLWR